MLYARMLMMVSLRVDSTNNHDFEPSLEYIMIMGIFFLRKGCDGTVSQLVMANHGFK